MLPDEGTIEVNGGVGAMIELSAGFVGDLTARENVYLISSLHGFTREQTDERFDEIFKWAGVQRFVDTPVMHFSSGMRARLAFSIVTRMEEPILLVDEVLAVGDKAFRKKCAVVIDRMLERGPHDAAGVAQRERPAAAGASAASTSGGSSHRSRVRSRRSSTSTTPTTTRT